MRILIIEDDPMNAKLFHLILTRKARCEVEVSEDPAYVAEQVRAGRADVVILDVSLSNSVWDGAAVDGLEICRRLKRDPETRHVPILLATAHAMKGARERFLAESGADDYIAKPILSAEDLIVRIRELAKKGAHGPASASR